MSPSYSPRIRVFREDLIKRIPRVPNNRESLKAFQGQRTCDLILAYCHWRMRSIPVRPRKVVIWGAGVCPAELQPIAPRLRPLMLKVESGQDLTPHLSEDAKWKGVVLPEAGLADRRADIDSVLVREGLHHFHIDVPSPRNPKGRSDMLVFADVTKTEFRIVAISDHCAFKVGDPESIRFFSICQAYIAKDFPPGQSFMKNPVMASGHSMIMRLFSDRCEREMDFRDAWLDTPAAAEELYAIKPMRDGQVIERPQKPQFQWSFQDLEFGILDKRTLVFFNLLPYFRR